MQLTEEREEVVSITSGRHLVLAPPGSGKTEMLSQRIRFVRTAVAQRVAASRDETGFLTRRKT